MGNYCLKNWDVAQSVAEYSILLVVVAAVLVFAINGPIKDSLNIVFNRTVEDIYNGLGQLVNGM